MDGVERPEWRRHRLAGPPQDGGRELHDLETLHDPINGLAARDRILRLEGATDAQPVDRPQALDFEQSAGHPQRNPAPLGEAARLSEHVTENDGRIDVRNHRARRSSSNMATPSTDSFAGGGSGMSPSVR